MAEPFPLIGRSRELERTSAALGKRESLLILGPAGSGRSTLIRVAIGASGVASETIHLEFSHNLHCLLVDLARRLLRTGHKQFCTLAPLKNEDPCQRRCKNP
jgi:predicted ABC-type transport system involved in lysophospholipase L1 biosynthesis ATPase subunit